MFTSKSLNIRKRWPPSWWSVACSALSQTVRTKAPCLYLLPRVPGVVITRFLFYSTWFPAFISFTLSINYYRNDHKFLLEAGLYVYSNTWWEETWTDFLAQSQGVAAKGQEDRAVMVGPSGADGLRATGCRDHES